MLASRVVSNLPTVISRRPSFIKNPVSWAGNDPSSTAHPFAQQGAVACGAQRSNHVALLNLKSSMSLRGCGLSAAAHGTQPHHQPSVDYDHIHRPAARNAHRHISAPASRDMTYVPPPPSWATKCPIWGGRKIFFGDLCRRNRD